MTGDTPNGDPYCHHGPKRARGGTPKANLRGLEGTPLPPYDQRYYRTRNVGSGKGYGGWGWMDGKTRRGRGGAAGGRGEGGR